MNTHSIIRAFGSFALACTCSAVAAQVKPPEPGVGPVSFWRLGPMEYTGLHEPMQRVVSSQGEFSQLWERMWSNHVSPPKVPTVDFSQESIIVLALGQRGTGGYSIRAQSVSYTEQSMEVVVSTTAPGPGCSVTTSFTAPVELLRLGRPAKPVKFLVLANTAKCGQ